MRDRNEYQQAPRLAPLRQHYAAANAQQKPRVPTWVKLAALVALIGLAGGLTGCGGGGSDAVELQPAIAPHAAAPAPVSVLVLGDSTMTPYWPGQQSTPDLLRAATGWAIENMAVSGTTACQAPLDAIRKTRAGVVVANYGLNDAYGANASPLHSTDAYAACLQKIADAAREAGAVLIWMESNPILSNPGWDAERIKSYDAVKRSIGPAYYCAQPAVAWDMRSLPDGMHPNNTARPAIAAALAACILRAI